MGTLQVGGTTLGVKNTVTNKVDLSNVGDVTLTSSANIKGAINASGDAPISACRAWAQFTISGTVESAFNVSSVEDTSSTVKKINFTTAMTDEFYACALTQINTSDSTYYGNLVKKDESTSSQLQTYIESESNTYGYTIAVFR